MKETSWVVVQYSQVVDCFIYVCMYCINTWSFDWALTRGFGLTFLGLSLYTKFSNTFGRQCLKRYSLLYLQLVFES